MGFSDEDIETCSRNLSLVGRQAASGILKTLFSKSPKPEPSCLKRFNLRWVLLYMVFSETRIFHFYRKLFVMGWLSVLVTDILFVATHKILRSRLQRRCKERGKHRKHELRRKVVEKTHNTKEKHVPRRAVGHINKSISNYSKHFWI